MRVLGVSAGAADGSAEILLKAALMQAEAAGHEVAVIRLDDLRIPTGPFVTAEPDDGPWFWEQVVEADGVIYATPIYSRTVPGKLRLLTDRVFGPNADVAFTEAMLERQRAGEPLPIPFPPDERVFRDRPTAFIASGGSVPDHWKTLTLPLLHTLVLSQRDPVVDQVCFAGSGTQQSVLLDPEAIERARRVGRNVAEQLGRSWDEAEYRGEEEDGACPVCHLSVIALRGDGVVECATCGAAGRLEVADGRATVVYAPAGLEQSVYAMAEKRDHIREVMATAGAHAERRGEIDAAAAPYAAWDRRITPD